MLFSTGITRYSAFYLGNENACDAGRFYLCPESWCNRYRLAARSKDTPDGSTGNIGFRCVVDA